MEERIKIFVVDDSEENRDGVTELLDAMGFDVANACSGEEALEKYKQFQPQVFLVDVKMPGMDGISLLRELHIENNCYEVIMMTGYESLNDAKKAMEFGAFSYLTKPLNRRELEEYLRKAYSMARLKQSRFDRLDSLKRKIENQTKELERSLQIMKAQANRIDAIMNSMAEGMLVVDNRENIVLINDKAQRILQISHVQSLGSNIREVLKGEKNISQLRRLLTETNGKRKEGYLQIDKGDGKGMRYFWATVSTVSGDDGENIGRIINFVDQTEKVRAAQMRNSFLSIVAHEFRTPITVLMNSSTLLELDNKNTEIRNQATADIKETTIHLKYLVNNIINIASVSDSFVKVNYENVNLYDLVYAQIDKLRVEAREKNISFGIKSKLENQMVCTDAKYLSIAITSLVHNAVKFNKENGSVTIILTAEKENSRRFIRISITDEGVGMTEEEQMHLFEEFYQAENPLTRRHGGLGIGLFLTKRAMDVLNGYIHVTSEKERGSTFTLRIPQ